jgi:hypothetical protein
VLRGAGAEVMLVSAMGAEEPLSAVVPVLKRNRFTVCLPLRAAWQYFGLPIGFGYYGI